MSKGSDRVRSTFNPSGNDNVDYIKEHTADLIDFVELSRAGHWEQSETANEVYRLVSLAQTAYEEACMWAVKAATFGQ
jgi:hypothetical protein